MRFKDEILHYHLRKKMLNSTITVQLVLDFHEHVIENEYSSSYDVNQIFLESVRQNSLIAFEQLRLSHLLYNQLMQD